MKQPKTEAIHTNISYHEDAQLLVKWVEAMHPIFHLNEQPPCYAPRRNDYLEATIAPMARWSFLAASMKYLAALHDGHMGSGLIDHASKYLAIDVIYSNGKLYTAKDGVAQDEITAICDAPTQNIFKAIDELTYAENEFARIRLYERMCRLPQFLMYAGCVPMDNPIITLGNRKQEIPLAPRNQHAINADYIIKCKQDDDVFIIDLRSFAYHSSVSDACAQIKKAISDGTLKFIIDLRGNGGGNSGVGEDLLNAMGMVPPLYGMHLIVSDYVVGRTNGAVPENLINYFAPDTTCAIANENIKLAVLTDTDTFSSARMFGVWVQDGNFGTVIGSPSCNAPNAYGDMTPFMLPLSGQYVQISRKKFYRPDVNADPNVLWPDIMVNPGEDAMTRALEFMKD
ncbi:MAG: S41 family peptidase [Defluviitaleaceae bacterium]|nr:S41 family peptidase [Defluviitaleaceae bacterium]